MLALANEAATLVTLYQVHGREAVIVREPWEIGNAPRADAMATDVPGFALGILTADCAPILLADPQARVIGAAHGGWKGVLAGVIEFGGHGDGAAWRPPGPYGCRHRSMHIAGFVRSRRRASHLGGGRAHERLAFFHAFESRWSLALRSWCLREGPLEKRRHRKQLSDSSLHLPPGSRHSSVFAAPPTAANRTTAGNFQPSCSSELNLFTGWETLARRRGADKIFARNGGVLMSEANGTRGMKLLAGNANRPLAEAIGQYLKLPSPRR